MRSLKKGDKLPEFSLKNQDGKKINVVDHIGKPMVIFFYPKDDTPGCTREVCAFRDDYQKFAEAGAVVFGISGDSVSSHLRFNQKYGLPFDLLSDPGDRVRKLFGVPSGLLGLLPGRVTYVVDEMGLIAEVFNDQFNFKKHVKVAIQEIEMSREQME